MYDSEVPSPINLKEMKDAKKWESTAMQRPFRMEFFRAFLSELQSLNLDTLQILELGSGPGFLAEFFFENLSNLTMTLLDNSVVMHELANNRLAYKLDRVIFIERDLKEAHWNEGLDKFDAVITLQAVHELRHKRYAQKLHSQVKPLLRESGVYLYCDHYFGSDAMGDNRLYMSLEEQRQSLESAGFECRNVFTKGGRALYRAIVNN